MPVKNESWILPMSLAAASVWADCIIVSDQGSTDGSRDIAKSFPKVHLIENDELLEFNEYKMREPLITTARELYGKGNVLISLDADEVLTPYFDSADFQKWQELPCGTIIQFFWGNIYKGYKRYWLLQHQNFGYIDDGKPFQTGLIHVPRLFVPSINNENVYECKSLGVIHFQYVDWERMVSKHRWYQCYERIHFPEKSAVEIYRRYHHMYNPSYFVLSVPDEWRRNYLSKGVDITDWKKEKIYWWDYKVISYLETYGERLFSQIDIWNYNWNTICYKKYKYKGTIKDKILLRYLGVTTTLVYRKGWRKLMRRTDNWVARWTCGRW